MHEALLMAEPGDFSPPIFLRRNRLVVVCIAWVLFAFGSTPFYANYIHDVGATFWALQVFLLPIALPLVWVFDRLLSGQKDLKRHPGMIAAIDSSFAISLWFVPALSIGCLVLLAVARFTAYAIRCIAELFK
jgi:hypothetical protein